MQTDELKRHVAETLDMFAGMKRAVHRQEGPDAVLPACLVVVGQSGPSAVLMLGHSHPLDNVATAWLQMLDDHKPAAVLFFTEGYMAGPSAGSTPGPLEQSYRDDPGSDVREVLTLEAVDIETGRQVSGAVAFTLAERGELLFDEPLVFEIDSRKDNGRIPSVLSLLRDATAYRLTRQEG